MDQRIENHEMVRGCRRLICAGNNSFNIGQYAGVGDVAVEFESIQDKVGCSENDSSSDTCGIGSLEDCASRGCAFVDHITAGGIGIATMDKRGRGERISAARIIDAISGL